MVTTTHRSSDFRSMPIGQSACLLTRLSCPWSSRLPLFWHSVKMIITFCDIFWTYSYYSLPFIQGGWPGILPFLLCGRISPSRHLLGHPWVGHNIAAIFSSYQHIKRTHLRITSIFFLPRPLIMRHTTTPASMLSQWDRRIHTTVVNERDPDHMHVQLSCALWLGSYLTKCTSLPS